MEKLQREKKELKILEDIIEERTRELNLINERIENEKNKAKDELLYERTLFKTLLDNIPDAIYFKDRDTRFVRVSKSMADFFNTTAENIIGKTDYDFFKKDIAEESFKDDIGIIESGTQIVNKEEIDHTIGEKKRWVSTTKLPWYNKNGNIIGMFGISRDITANKMMEKKQKQLVLELEGVNKELNDFAYIVSHDLKAPLRAINVLSEWILSDYIEKFDEEGKEQLNLLSVRVKRMSGLIDGILKYSRIGRIKEKKSEIDLNVLIKEVIDLIVPPENIQIEIENELPVVTGEETRIEQVFQNLLSNAIKYMDKHRGEIKIGCSENSSYWKFYVSDNGSGIDEKYFSKIFKIFQTLRPRDEVESTGVGLTIIKKIVEMHGGKVWVESKLDYGSTFFFTLPKNKNNL